MKKYIFPVTGLIISGICFVAYNLIGSHVAEDGTLVEPFYLSAIGSIVGALSIILLLTMVIMSLVKRIELKKEKDN